MALVLAIAASSLAQQGQVSRPRSIFPLAVRWAAPLTAPPAAWPSVDTDRAYVVLRNGFLVAVSLVDGKIQWTREGLAPLAPASGDGLVFAAEGSTILALDAASGALVWQATLQGNISAPPFWNSGWLIAGAEQGELVALRARDGTPVWRASLDGMLRAQPSIAGEWLYLSLDGNRIASVNLLTGDKRWLQVLGGQVGRILALGDRLFVGATDNFFYCLALGDGTIKWRWRTGADIVGVPQVDNDHVYFVSLDNLLRALDWRTGVQRWRRDLPMRPSTGLHRIGGLLLVSGVTPEVAAFYAEDGEPAGILRVGAELGGPPQYLDQAPPHGEPALLLLTTQLNGESQLLSFGPAVGPPLTPANYVPGMPVDGSPANYIPGIPLGLPDFSFKPAS